MEIVEEQQSNVNRKRWLWRRGPL